MDEMFDFNECLLIIVSKWKIVLIITVVFAIMAGGYRGGKESKIFKDLEKMEETYLMDIDTYSAQKALLSNRIDLSIRESKNLEEYMQNSLLMQANPYNIDTGVLSLYIDTGYTVNSEMTVQSPDKSKDVMNAYLAIFEDEDFYTQICKELSIDIDCNYIKELLSITIEDNIMRIKTLMLSNEQFEQVVKIVLQHMDKYQPVISTTIVEHTVSEIKRAHYVTESQSLILLQNNGKERLSKLENDIRELQKDFSNLKRPEKSIPTKSSALKKVVVYVLIGAIGGVAIGIFFAFLLDAINPTINSGKDVRSALNTNYLGFIPSRKKRIVDSFLNYLQGEKIDNSDAAFQRIAISIYGRRKEQKNSFSFLVEDNSIQQSSFYYMKQKMQLVTDRMSFEQISKDIMSLQKIETIQEKDGIILIEQRYQSNINQVKERIEFYNNVEIMVVGVILV